MITFTTNDNIELLPQRIDGKPEPAGRKFLSGEIPTNHIVIRPVGKPLPIDENGNRRLEFGNYGRGRLLGELYTLFNDESLDEELREQIQITYYGFSAYLSDLSVFIPTDLPNAGPVVNYKPFNAEHVLFYPDWEEPKFQAYQQKLIQYNELVERGAAIPDDLIEELDRGEKELFYGPINEQKRAEEIEGWLDAHLLSPIGELIVKMLLFIGHEPGGLLPELPKMTVEAVEPDKLKLFSNSKDLKPGQFAMPKFPNDNYNRAIKDISYDKSVRQYQAAEMRVRGRVKQPAYKINNRETETEFIFDAEKTAIQTAEDFAKQVGRLKDPKVMQTLFALWKWANLKDTRSFREVPISEVMALVLSENDDNKFNTPQRREFSEILEYLASITITESIIGERVNKKTGKKRPEMTEEKGLRLFRLVATYSVKKEFQNLPKDQLDRNIHFDKSVITRFSGELLPDRPHLFSQRASIYFDGLLQLRANHDGKAILMGFNIQTRFNQMQNKADFIEVDRAYLINLCDYQKTDQSKPAKATKQLTNNFEKLIKIGLISAYKGLTNSDTDRIKIYPPQRELKPG